MNSGAAAAAAHNINTIPYLHTPVDCIERRQHHYVCRAEPALSCCREAADAVVGRDGGGGGGGCEDDSRRCRTHSEQWAAVPCL